MKCTKKHVKDIFFTWWHMPHMICVFLNAPKSKSYIFSSFSVLKLITCFFLNAQLFMFVFMKCPIFSDSENEMKSIWFFDFGAFKKMHMWKITWKIYDVLYIFHVIFGAFHNTSRMSIFIKLCLRSSLIVRIPRWDSHLTVIENNHMVSCKIYFPYKTIESKFRSIFCLKMFEW